MQPTAPLHLVAICIVARRISSPTDGPTERSATGSPAFKRFVLTQGLYQNLGPDPIDPRCWSLTDCPRRREPWQYQSGCRDCRRGDRHSTTSIWLNASIP